MANDPTQNANTGPAQDGEGGDEPDYKALYEQALAESRKWESRSKANKEKADKYDEAAAGKESIEARIAAIEAENATLKANAARAEIVSKVAKATGVAEAIVSSLAATDEEGLTAAATAIAEAYKTPGGAPYVPEAGAFPKGEDGADDADWLRVAIENK